MTPEIIILSITGISFTVLIVYLFWRNQKDRQEFERQLNQDYRKPHSHSAGEEENNHI
jgi:hypothetical protein